MSQPALPLARSSQVDDLALLRAFEPIVRYNEGELFFPTGVEGYLAECDLLVGTVGARPRGARAARRADHGRHRDLRRAARQSRSTCGWSRSRSTASSWRAGRRRPDRPHFRAPGRLARVGLFARLVDAGFTASLLLRGTVPGGTAAAAQVKYARAARSATRATSTTAASCAGTAGSCSSTCSSTS